MIETFCSDEGGWYRAHSEPMTPGLSSQLPRPQIHLPKYIRQLRLYEASACMVGAPSYFPEYGGSIH